VGLTAAGNDEKGENFLGWGANGTCRKIFGKNGAADTPAWKGLLVSEKLVHQPQAH